MVVEKLIKVNVGRKLRFFSRVYNFIHEKTWFLILPQLPFFDKRKNNLKCIMQVLSLKLSFIKSVKLNLLH